MNRKFLEIVRRSWHLAVPGVATAALAFMAGGYFAVATGLSVAVVCLLLVARVTLANRPFAGWSVLLAVTAGALALFAVWVMLSGGWSQSSARALVESNRPLLYGLMLVFVGLHARGPGQLAVLLRWVALAIAVTCAAALLTRLLPTTFPTKAGIHVERLAFPLTYWNSLGIFSAVGLILGTHFTCSQHEPGAVRVAAAAALPVVAVTLYFTFSRGGIAAACIGVVLYLVLAHPRGVLTAVPAAGIPLAIAVHEAYGKELLARYHGAGPANVAQGHSLLVAVIACMVAAAILRGLALPLDRRLARPRIPTRTRVIAYGTAGLVAVLALVVAFAAFDLSGKLADERSAFERGNTPPGTADLRTRLTAVGNNGRLDMWRVALREAARDPWRGGGAGTYRLAWERDRPKPPAFVTEGHSLYYEVRAELGWVGIALLFVALVVPLGAAVPRLWGQERHPHGAFLAAGGALLLHSMVDWDWEMSALFLWFFGAAGLVLATPAAVAERLRAPGRLTRLLAALAFLLLAVTPLTVARSSSRLNDAQQALKTGNCVKATDLALDSLAALPSQAGAFEVLGWCDLRAGRARLGLSAMRNAQRRDPDNWQYAYGIAVTQTFAGEDPRPAAAQARRLNPLEPKTRDLTRAVRPNSPARRRVEVAKLQIPVD